MRRKGSETKESLLLRIAELERENQNLQQQLKYYQEEQDHFRKRQAKGIANAKRNGTRFGRPELKIPDNFLDVAERYQKGNITGRMASEELGISTNTFRKWLKKQGLEPNRAAELAAQGNTLLENEAADEDSYSNAVRKTKTAASPKKVGRPKKAGRPKKNAAGHPEMDEQPEGAASPEAEEPTLPELTPETVESPVPEETALSEETPESGSTV